jgi:hypothetical protein
MDIISISSSLRCCIVKHKSVLLMAQGRKYRLQVYTGCRNQEVISNFHFHWHSFPSVSLAVSSYCILSVTCTLTWDFSFLPRCSWGLLSSGMLCGIGWLVLNVSRSFKIGPQSNCLTHEDVTNRCSEMSVINHHPTRHNIPQQCRPFRSLITAFS